MHTDISGMYICMPTYSGIYAYHIYIKYMYINMYVYDISGLHICQATYIRVYVLYYTYE